MAKNLLNAPTIELDSFSLTRKGSFDITELTGPTLSRKGSFDITKLSSADHSSGPETTHPGTAAFDSKAEISVKAYDLIFI
ncbi:hypothetical protein AB4097_04265 [Microvirga sp. 2MCAF35]|uniref:hypothetical protein n=1 Tax=Microvirga sp. 2MCAF35 TaxID=3232987 RepID=UPI003F94F796